MTTLLAKDLRLSLDALRPWALLVIGCAIAGVLWLGMPESLMPEGIARLSVGELLAGVGIAVALTGVVVAAWCSAVVVHGDRAHGADALSHAVPVRSSLRLSAKLGAILVGVLAPAIVASALYELGEILSPTVTDGRARWLFGLALAGSAIGAGLSLAVAPWVRRASSAVAVALVCGVGLAVLGALVGWDAFPVRARELIEAITLSRAGDQGFELRRVDALRTPAAFLAAIWALGIGAIGAWMLGIVQLAMPRPGKWVTVLACGVVGVAVIASGASLWIHPTVSRAEVGSLEYGELIGRLMGDEALAARVRSFGGSRESRESMPFRRDASRGVLEAAIERIRSLPPDSAARESLRNAVRSLYEMSSEFAAFQSILLAGRIDDPQLVPMTLDAVLRFPQSTESLQWLAVLLEIRDERASLDFDFVNGKLTAASERRLAALELDCLRDLVAQGHPESERMERVIEILSRRLEQTDEKAPAR